MSVGTYSVHPLCKWAAGQQRLTEGVGLTKRTQAAEEGTRGRANNAHNEGKSAIY